MKKQISIFSIISFLAIALFIIISCEKEELLPSITLDTNVTESALESTFLENNSQNGDGIEPYMTYEEAFNADRPPGLDVSIMADPCFNKGNSLFVYNAHDPDLDFYYSGKYHILWYKDEIPMKGVKRLECVCRGEFAVLVIDMVTNQSVGMAFFTGGNCLAEEVKTTTDLYSKEAPNFNLTYEELIVDTEFQEEPKWNISIEATSCTRMGTTLRVFSENQPHVDFNNSGRFFVFWFKDGKAIDSNTDRLDCVCSGKYGVVIIRKYDNKGIGKAYQKVRACHSIDLTTADDGEI